MAYIQQLALTDFRNITSARFELNTQHSVVVGDNGSGKTSLIEALYLLSHYRSFRTSKVTPLIHHDADSFVLTGEVRTNDDLVKKVGMEKRRRHQTSDSLLKIDGVTASSAGELAKLLPSLLINPHSFDLLEAGPQLRRQFIDWGVFHVKHDAFSVLWRKASRLLKQRNQALKSDKLSHAELASWDHQFADLSIKISQLRADCYQQFETYLATVIAQCGLPPVTVAFEAGFRADHVEGLVSELASQRERDRRFGFTHSGFHKADLSVHLSATRKRASDYLSRGQIKLLVCALKIAMADTLHSLRGEQSIILMDDADAELDKKSLATVTTLLRDRPYQTISTTLTNKVDDEYLSNLNQPTLLHMSQGVISTSNNG